MSKMKWICTDPDTNQWGRKISAGVFEFKEDIKYPNGDLIKEQSIIHLSNYSDEEKQNHLDAFGYVLNDLYQSMTKNQADWLIAECIFEVTSD